MNGNKSYDGAASPRTADARVKWKSVVIECDFAPRCLLTNAELCQQFQRKDGGRRRVWRAGGALPRCGGHSPSTCLRLLRENDIQIDAAKFRVRNGSANKL